MFEMRTLIISVFAFLLCGLVSSANSAVPRDSADDVIRSYISAEEGRDYSRVYKLLSATKKKQLKRENAVGDVASYVRLRHSSEARWFNFVETSRRQSNSKTVATFLVIVEENGEREQATLTLRLSFQGGVWRIDSIDY